MFGSLKFKNNFGTSERLLMTAVFVVGMLLIALFPITLAQGQQPKYGGTFIIAGVDATTLNPGLNTVAATHNPASLIFNGLVTKDYPNPQPDLAESWTISSDGLTYTFTLRQNVTWHDGFPFTSADVKYTLEQVSSKFNPWGKVALAQLDRVDTPDNYTAIIRIKKPTPFLLVNLWNGPAAILPMHIYNGTDVLTNKANLAPIGTGPFKLQEWVVGDHITLVKNQNYFKKGLPYLDEVIFKVIPDANTRVTAIETGAIDFIPSQLASTNQLKRLEAVLGITVSDTHTVIAAIYWLGVNLNNSILSNLQVRKALSYAIDRSLLVNLTLFGYGSVSWTPFGASAPWISNNITKYPYNPDLANTMLDGAGYPKGTSGIRFGIRLAYDNTLPVSVSGAQAIQALFRAIGVEVTLVSLDTSSFNDKVYVKWDYDMFIAGTSTGPDPNVQLTRWFTSSNILHVANTNPFPFNDSRVDQLFDLAGVEMDTQTRIKYFEQIQQIISDQLPVICLNERQYIDTYRNEFVNVSSAPYAVWAGSQETVWWAQGTLPPPTSDQEPPYGIYAVIAAVVVIIAAAGVYLLRRRSKSKS